MRGGWHIFHIHINENLILNHCRLHILRNLRKSFHNKTLYLSANKYQELCPSLSMLSKI
jgi:hypothetical protein